MAIIKGFTTVRVKQDIYNDVRAEADSNTPSPTITHLVNTLIAEALYARKRAKSRL